MTRITRNFFFKGRNTDTSHSLIDLVEYVEGHNVELIGQGQAGALQNIKGTLQVKSILGEVVDGTIVPGMFGVKLVVGGQRKNAIILFVAVPGGNFQIYAFDCDGETLYELFQEPVSVNYFATDRVVDAVNFPENGIDILYFTDNFNEPRYLRCEIPDSYAPNFLTAYDLSLLRRGANGTIDCQVTDEGSLLSGTYQFAYRMVDPVNKKFTKWSSLTNPVHCYSHEDVPGAPVDGFFAGYGMPTDRSIRINISPAFDEVANFDYLQLAVVENTGPTSPNQASLLEVTLIASPTLTFDYLANNRIGTIPLTDITVNLAQIDHLKTLAVKENVLFAGNIQYTELEFDNGVPTISSGAVIVRSSSERNDSYVDENFASTQKGYWRDEVYRFGIVYRDSKGNESPVQPLNLSGVTGNTISGGLMDLKFPSRSTSNSYSILSASNKTQALGLQLTGLVNHPTWARSFEIVRVLRKKNILFQSPLIPMATVQGTGANSNYPSMYWNGIKNTSISDAQPQTAGTVLVPKNLMWPELRSIVQNGQPIASVIPGPFGPLTNPSIFRSANEVALKRTLDYSFGALFPAQSIYSDQPFQYSGSEKLDVVDYALLKLDRQDFKGDTIPSSYDAGSYIETSVSSTFYALNNAQYYFDPTWSGKSISSSFKNIPITDYEYFSGPDAQPASVGGLTALNYEALQTKGIGFWQYQPSIQRMGVIQLGREQSERALTFKAGILNFPNNNGYIIGSSGPRYEDENRLSNDYFPEYASFTNRSSHVSALPIINVKLGLGDDRYGDPNSFHEYISTGAKYTFSEAEVATLQSGGSVSVDLEVWGGDCFIGPHLFKVCDSAFSVTNQRKNNSPSAPDSRSSLVGKWNSVYLYSITDATDPVQCIPVALKNCAQYVEVILESEYNGEVRDNESIGRRPDENGFPVFCCNEEANARSPLAYKYNTNLSKENSQKIYVPKPQHSFEQNYFGARIVYSDIKIYNSEQVGFDTFRVANFYDLEEKNHNLTKLALSGDDLIAIQEQAVLYLPTSQQQLEQTNGGTLAVRSLDVIGRPIVIDSRRGSKHLQSVVEAGGMIFFCDTSNAGVFVVSNKTLTSISDLSNATTFRQQFSGSIPENKLVGIYDPIRCDYLIIDNHNFKCQVFNQLLGIWVGEYDFSESASCLGGTFVDDGFYVIGKTNALGLYKMYEGDVNQLFGEAVVPRVTVVVNPDEPISKTFDDIMIVATQRLSSLDLEVKRETELGNQTVTGINLDSTSIEGNFRVKVMRDSVGARLRGQRMLATIKWKAVQSAVSSINTKYRPSSRTPW